MENECKKCTCADCRRESQLTLRLIPGQYFVDGLLCFENKIIVKKGEEDISTKCCGVILIDDSLFGIVDKK